MNNNTSWLLGISGSVKVEKNIYFSNSLWNGLFKIDTNSCIVKYLGSFPNEPMGAKLLHHAALTYGNKLYFFPWVGADYFQVYDLESRSFFSFPFPRKYYDSVRDAFVFNDHIYIVPCYSDFPIYMLDSETYELIPIFLNDDVGNGRFRTHVICKEGKFIYSYTGVDRIYIYDLAQNKNESYLAPINNIRDIYDVEDSLWITLLGSYDIWQFRKGEFFKVYDGCLNFYEFPNNDYAYGEILHFSNYVVVPPAEGIDLMCKNGEKFNIVYKCEEERKNMGQSHLYLKMEIIDNNLWLLPYESENLLIFDEHLQLILKGKLILEDESIRKKIWKKLIADRTVLREGKGFQLVDLLYYTM